MAKKVKDTPILDRREARELERQIRESRKISREDYERAMRVYREVIVREVGDG